MMKKRFINTTIKGFTSKITIYARKRVIRSKPRQHQAIVSNVKRTSGDGILDGIGKRYF